MGWLGRSILTTLIAPWVAFVGIVITGFIGMAHPIIITIIIVISFVGTWQSVTNKFKEGLANDN